MPLSTNVLLDHIANYLIYLSDTPSFWYTLNTSYDHQFHLSKQFGLSPRDYECLLAAANLAHHTKSGFTIKPKEWKIFLDGHYFTIAAEGIDECKVEFDKKKMNIDALINNQQQTTKRVSFYVLRIGALSKHSPRKIEYQKNEKGQLITTPPRFCSLGLAQRSFRKLIDPFIWNYIVENNLEDSAFSLPNNQLSSTPPSSNYFSELDGPE